MAPLSDEDLRFRLKVSAILSCFLLDTILTLLLAIYLPSYLSSSASKLGLAINGLGGGIVTAVSIALCRWLMNNELSRQDGYKIYIICAIVPLLVRISIALTPRCR